MVYSFSWLYKNKKPATNSINKIDNKCFQYAATLALNHRETGKHLKRIKKIKLFIEKYNSDGRNKLSIKKSWVENVLEHQSSNCSKCFAC